VTRTDGRPTAPGAKISNPLREGFDGRLDEIVTHSAPEARTADLDSSVVVNGDRRSFALLQPIVDTTAQTNVRDLILEAYAQYEEVAEAATA
jgi:hypothetical protein